MDGVEPAAEVYVDCPLLGWERFEIEPDDLEDKVDWSGLDRILANHGRPR